MIPDLKNRTIHFKNRDVGYRIVERLLELECKNPKQFGYAVEWIQKMYEQVNVYIGKSTAIGYPYKPVYCENKNVLDLDSFIELRFKDPELGRKLVITLIEIEAREIETDTFYGILGGVEFAHADVFLKEERPKFTAEILPFPEQKH